MKTTTENQYKIAIRGSFVPMEAGKTLLILTSLGGRNIEQYTGESPLYYYIDYPSSTIRAAARPPYDYKKTTLDEANTLVLQEIERLRKLPESEVEADMKLGSKPLLGFKQYEHPGDIQAILEYTGHKKLSEVFNIQDSFDESVINDEQQMRQFSTGATRNIDSNKLDFEGFLSPLAIKAFAEYMHKNRLQADGQLRDSDNWQKGIPIDAYMKSMWRHFFDVWATKRGQTTHEDQISNLCGLMFNVQGMLHELLKEQLADSYYDKSNSHEG